MTGERTELQIPEVMHIESVTGNSPQPPPVDTAPKPESSPKPEPKSGGQPPAEDTPPEAPQRTQRELAMEAIALNRRKAIERELSYGEQMADDARADAGLTPLQHAKRSQPAVFDDPDAAPPAVEAPVQQAQQQEVPQQPVQRQPAADQIVTLGGQQFRVTPEQMAQLASLGALTINALQQQNRQQQQSPQAPQQQSLQVQQQPAQQQPQHILSPEESKALATRIQYGNETESARALEDMTNLIANRIAAAHPQVDPRQVVAFATQQALQQMRAEQALNANLTVIGNEYPEIFSNNSKAQLAAIKLDGIRRRDALLGVQQPDLMAYREACEEVRRDLGTPPPAPPQPQLQPTQTQGNSPPAQAGQPAQTRFEAKRAAPRSPIPAQRVAAADDQTSRFPSPAEVVAAMRKRRGQG